MSRRRKEMNKFTDLRFTCMLACYLPFCDAVQEILQFALYENRRLWFVGQPNEGQLALHRRQDVAVVPPSFAHLSLGAIAIDSTFEVTFGHREEHLDLSSFRRDVHRRYCTDYPQRESRESAVAIIEKRLYGFAATEAFFFRKGFISSCFVP